MELEYVAIPTPPNPDQCLPVRTMLSSVGSREQIHRMIRGGVRKEHRGGHSRILNGLEMFKVQFDGKKTEHYVAYVDCFCAWFSHRQVFKGQRKKTGHIVPPPSRNASIRKKLDPAWIRAHAQETNFTKKLIHELQVNKGVNLRWKIPQP